MNIFIHTYIHYTRTHTVLSIILRIFNLFISDVFVTRFAGSEVSGEMLQEMKQRFKGCKLYEYCIARNSNKFVIGNRSRYTASGLGQFCNHRQAHNICIIVLSLCRLKYQDSGSC